MRVADVPKDSWVIDLGAGDGFALTHWERVLNGKHIGIDNCRQCIRAALNNGANVVHGDICTLNIRSTWYGVASAIETLRYCRQPQLAINEASRVLLHGGWLLIVDGSDFREDVAKHPALMTVATRQRNGMWRIAARKVESCVPV